MWARLSTASHDNLTLPKLPDVANRSSANSIKNPSELEVEHFVMIKKNIRSGVGDKPEEKPRRCEASASCLLRLWLRPRSPCQHMSWPRVLTAARRGFHQAPRDLPTVQTTAALIVHCAATFSQSASRILRSLPALYSILKVSYHSPCQVKPEPRTRTANTFHCGLGLQMLGENKIVDVTDMSGSTRWSQAGPQRAKPLPLGCSGEGPRATGLRSFHYICCQANCRLCTLWFWMGV